MAELAKLHKSEGREMTFTDYQLSISYQPKYLLELNLFAIKWL